MIWGLTCLTNWVTRMRSLRVWIALGWVTPYPLSARRGNAWSCIWDGIHARRLRLLESLLSVTRRLLDFLYRRYCWRPILRSANWDERIHEAIVQTCMNFIQQHRHSCDQRRLGPSFIGHREYTRMTGGNTIVDPSSRFASNRLTRRTLGWAK